MGKNTLKFVLIVMLLGIGLTFKATPAVASDFQPCDGVGVTTDGCDTLPSDLEILACYEEVFSQAVFACTMEQFN